MTAGSRKGDNDADSDKAEVRLTDSGIEVLPVYTAEDLDGWDPETQLGAPGAFPYTRGIHPTMYRGRLWTMRQYAGFGSAESTNERFKFLLGAGQTGLSCAFDLPTQMGYDSDHPRADGEVGRVGVAIDSLADMRLLLADLPLGEVTTSMTINATAAILLLLYSLVAEENGVGLEVLGGTIQNDILKEYVARGTYIYPPRHSMRIVTDIFSWCREEHAAVEHDLDLGLPHTRGGLHRSPGRSRSRLPTASPTSRQQLRRVSRSTTSDRGSASFGTPITTCSKRWPNTERPGGCGPG